METFLGHPGLQIFFMGLPEGKGIPNKAHDLTETRGLYSQRNPSHTAGKTDISDEVRVWYGEHRTVWLSVAVTYRK
jgi:hypothetical protein